MVGWLAGWLARLRAALLHGWLARLGVALLHGWLASWLVGKAGCRIVAWLVGQLVGWQGWVPHCYMVGWPAGWLTRLVAALLSNKRSDSVSSLICSTYPKPKFFFFFLNLCNKLGLHCYHGWN